MGEWKGIMGLSANYFCVVDEMSRRLDTLEQNMQAGNERDGKSSPTKM